MDTNLPKGASLPQPTDVRFSGQLVKVKYIGNVFEDWCVGVYKLDIVAMGKR